jgi:methyl-accepting chemotaxis protein
MTLVKTSKIAGSAAKTRRSGEAARPAVVAQPTASRNRGNGKALGKDKVSERVAAATEELASGLAQASAAAEELRRSMEQISAGAEEAAGASQEQLTAIKQVSTNLVAARSEADNSRRRTESAQVLLAETAAQIGVSIQSIERNSERQVASGAIISELERRAKDVSEITGAVSRISDQTNLLALNAAIEAARAGEQGRGFAVVADEVRKLAERTTQATSQINSMISTIQNEVEHAGVAMNNATARVESGVEFSKKAGDSLGNIVGSVNNLQSMVQQIASATEEMSTVSETISSDIQGIAEGSKEISAGSGQIAQASSDLARLATELQSVVGHFKV